MSGQAASPSIPSTYVAASPATTTIGWASSTRSTATPTVVSSTTAFTNVNVPLSVVFFQQTPIYVPQSEVKTTAPGAQSGTTVVVTSSTLTLSGENTATTTATVTCPQSVEYTETTAAPHTVYVPGACIILPNAQVTQTASVTTPGTSAVSGATLTSSTASTNGTTSHPGSSKSDAGAIAGAAVGAAIGAALIAFLATFLFYRRKRRNNRGGVYMNEKPSSDHAWDAFLPQSADDGTIQRSVNALYSQIDMHVENFYGINAMASISTESRVCLQKVDSGLLPKSMEELMRETANPLPVIKHCFAWVILSRLSPTTTGEDSLLPPELARAPPKQTTSKSRSERENRAMAQAYPYWRILTAHLLYPQSRQNSSSLSLNAHGADDVVQVLSIAFQPWSKNVKSGASAPEHLSSVIKTATETGLLIMSQPSTFSFEWDVTDNKANNVVVLPAFEKTADEQGQALSQRYFLVNPKTESVS